MNILVLTNIYPYEKDNNPDRTKVISYFAKQWTKMGHHVVVVINSASFPLIYYNVGNLFSEKILKKTRLTRLPNKIWKKRFEFTDEDAQVINLPMKKFLPHGKFSNRQINKQIKSIVEYLKTFNFIPDIITGHWLNPQLLLVSNLKKIYNCKTAFVFHSDYDFERYKKFNVQKYLKNIDHVGFRSLSSLKLAGKFMIFNNEPFVCSSGIPSKFIDSYVDNIKKKFSKDKLSVITAGRLVEYKQMDKIIIALSKVKNKEKYSLIIAGEGPFEIKLKNEVTQRNVSNVSFLGMVKREKLQELLQKTDVFCLISEKEVFGLVYLEAMLQGCIVIASKLGALDGIIKDGTNGFLCEEGNNEELTKILNKIYSLDVATKFKISQSAINTAKKYTDYNTAKQYLDNICK